MLTLKESRRHFGRSTHLLVIGVTKKDYKMKSMLRSFVLALLCAQNTCSIRRTYAHTQLQACLPDRRVTGRDKFGRILHRLGTELVYKLNTFEPEPRRGHWLVS
eukprot:282077-Pelagomonas_calceolata.AAC.3